MNSLHEYLKMSLHDLRISEICSAILQRNIFWNRAIKTTKIFLVITSRWKISNGVNISSFFGCLRRRAIFKFKFLKNDPKFHFDNFCLSTKSFNFFITKFEWFTEIRINNCHSFCFYHQIECYVNCMSICWVFKGVNLNFWSIGSRIDNFRRDRLSLFR